VTLFLQLRQLHSSPSFENTNQFQIPHSPIKRKLIPRDTFYDYNTFYEFFSCYLRRRRPG
jgi:hypothetical protein